MTPAAGGPGGAGDARRRCRGWTDSTARSRWGTASTSRARCRSISQGRLVGENDRAAQITQSLANVCALVRAAHGLPADVVRLTFYIVDYTPDVLDQLKTASAAVFPDSTAPAVTIVGRQRPAGARCPRGGGRHGRSSTARSPTTTGSTTTSAGTPPRPDPASALILAMLHTMFLLLQATATGPALGAPGARGRPAQRGGVPWPRRRGSPSTITIDGVLDEPAWSTAARLTGFHQYQPVDGRPAEEQTTVLVWYAPDAIYFGIHALDNDPQDDPRHPGPARPARRRGPDHHLPRHLRRPAAGLLLHGQSAGDPGGRDPERGGLHRRDAAGRHDGQEPRFRLAVAGAGDAGRATTSRSGSPSRASATPAGGSRRGASTSSG